MHLRLFALGFGNVGRALTQMLAEKASELHDRYNLTLGFTGIFTRSTGQALFPEGVSATQLREWAWPSGRVGTSVPLPQSEVLDFIRRCPADVVLELTPLNPHSGQPAIDYIRTALEAGRHV